MENNALIEIGLPVSLAIIMIGMGLSLTLADFRRVAEQPKGVALGTAIQLALIPLVGFLFAWGWGGGVLATGLVLTALCPGGTTSNLICYLARSNLALSITLTVISSFACIFTIPPLLNLALEMFTGEGEIIRLSFVKTLITMSVIVLIPVAIGMLVRHFQPDFAIRVEPVVSKVAGLFLVFLVIVIVVSQYENAADWLARVWLPVVLLNLVAIAVGFGCGRLGGLPPADALTVTIEVSIRNTTIGLLVAINLLKNVELAIAPAIYGLLMYASAFVLVRIGQKMDREATATG